MTHELDAFLSPEEKTVPQTHDLDAFLQPPKVQKEGLFFIPTKEEYGEGGLGSNAVNLGLGMLRNVTWPADVAQAIALENMREEERENLISGNIEGAKAAHAQQIKIAERFPTQENLEKKAEEKLGIPLQPRAAEERIARSTGTLGVNPIGLLGAMGEETLNQMGVPPWLSAMLAGGGVAAGKAFKAAKPAQAATQEAQQLRDISKKHDLPYMRGVEEQVPRQVTPEIPLKKHEKLTGKLSAAQEAAVEKIIDKSIPISQGIKQGVSPKRMYDRAYALTRERAAKTNKKVETAHINSWIDNKIKQLESKALSLGASAETYLDVLKKEKAQLSRAKDMTAQQATDQVHQWNENISSAYKRPELIGKSEAYVTAYNDLKREVVAAIEKSGIPEVAKPFKIAQDLFAQTKRFESTYNILGDALGDPTKLSKVLKSKKRGFLERNLGQNATKELDEIARYSKTAQDRVLKQVEVRNMLEEQFRGLNLFGSSILAAKKIAKSLPTAYKKAQGYLFTSDKVRKDYADLVKNLAKSGSLKVIQNSADKLEKSIKEDFGTVDALFLIAEDIDEE